MLELGGEGLGALAHGLGRVRTEQAVDDCQQIGAGGDQLWGALQGDAADGDDGSAEDRKSTRLNSSHVRISYAVFCLKKKKKKKITSVKDYEECVEVVL